MINSGTRTFGYQVIQHGLICNQSTKLSSPIDFYLLPMAIFVFGIRYSVEKYCIMPIGLGLGIVGAKPKKMVHIEVLERAFNKKVKMKHSDVAGLAKRLDWSERQVERWLRLRLAQNKPSKLVKFVESGWRFTYFASSFSFGLYVLWDKPWLWDTDFCWKNYPHHGVPRSVWWYYMTTSSYYWSLMGSQFYDVKRKDFWQMFAHHVLTLCLLLLSWACRFHRIVSLTILIHDLLTYF